MSNLYKISLASFFQNLIFALPIVALFLNLKGLTLSEMFWLESISVITVLLFEIPTGIIADKIGRKKSLVLSNIIWLLAWIPWFLANSFFVFSFHYILIGIAIALMSGTDQAFIYDDLKEKGLERNSQKAFGLYGASLMWGGFVAGLVTAFILKQQNLETFYLLFKLTVVAQVVSLIFRLSLKEPKRTFEGGKIETAPESSFSLFKSGTKLLKENKNLQKIILLSLFSFPFIELLTYVFQPYFIKSNVTPMWFGIAFALSSLLAGTLRMYSYKAVEWFGVNKGILIVSLLPAVMWGFMAVIFNPIIAVILYILNGGIGSMRDPIFADFYNKHISSHNRATVLSTISFLVSLYLVVMQPLLGYLADYKLSYAFLAVSLLIIFGSIFFRIEEKHLEKIEV